MNSNNDSFVLMTVEALVAVYLLSWVDETKNVDIITASSDAGVVLGGLGAVWAFSKGRMTSKSPLGSSRRNRGESEFMRGLGMG